MESWAMAIVLVFLLAFACTLAWCDVHRQPAMIQEAQ